MRKESQSLVPLSRQLQQLKEGHFDPIIFGYKSYIVFTQVKHKTSLNCAKCLRVVGKRHFFHSVLKRTLQVQYQVTDHRGKGAPCGYSQLMGWTIPTQVINSHLTVPSITTRGSSTIFSPRLKTNFVLKPWDTNKSPTPWRRQENPGRRCTGMTQREGMGREVEGGFGTGAHRYPVADSCQCMTKTTTILYRNQPPIKINNFFK